MSLMTRPQTWHPHRWAALFPLLLAVFMDMLDNQIVAVALPSIQHEQQASGSALEWIASGYTLAYALLLITGGRLGDRYSARTVFLCGTLGFTLASLLAGLSPTVGVLIGARIVQGAFAGLMVPQVLAVIRTEFPDEERGKAFALFGATFPLGGAAGPLLGGLLTQADIAGLGWRSIFLVNLPIGLIALGCSAAFLPRRAGRPEVRIDRLGVVLFALPLFAVLYPLVEGWSIGWPVWTILLMLAAIPLAGLFVHQQSKRRTDPLIGLGMLRRREMSAGLPIGILFTAAMGTFVVLTMHLQNGLHYSPLQTALTFLPITLGIVAGNGSSAALLRKLGKNLIPVGLIAGILGIAALCLALYSAGEQLHSWELIPGAVLLGYGLGTVMSSVLTVILAEVPAEEAGSASGVVNTAMQLGPASGIALLGTVFFAGGATASATITAFLVAAGLLLAALLLAPLLPGQGGQDSQEGERVDQVQQG